MAQQDERPHANRSDAQTGPEGRKTGDEPGAEGQASYLEGQDDEADVPDADEDDDLDSRGNQAPRDRSGHGKGRSTKGLAQQVANYDIQERIADSLERIADTLGAIARKLEQTGGRGGPGGPPGQDQRFRGGGGDYRRGRDDRPRDRGGYGGPPDRRGGGGPSGGGPGGGRGPGGGGGRDRFRGPGRRWGNP
jgi:hypothetical protein